MTPELIEEPETISDEESWPALDDVRDAIEVLITEMTYPPPMPRLNAELEAARRVQNIVQVILGDIVDLKRTAWVKGEEEEKKSEVRRMNYE